MISSVQYILFSVLCCGLTLGDEVCSPDDNLYYHLNLKKCMHCDGCLIGMGKDTVNGKNKIRWDTKHGAVTCTPCIPCKKGYYNDRRGYNCKPCNDCSQQNRYELKSCSFNSDAVCGGFIPTTIPKNVQSVNSTEVRSSESKIMLIFVVATVGIFLMSFIVMLLIYTLWKHLRHREDKAIINRLNNVEQLPLVNELSSKPSNISSATNLLERNSGNRDRESETNDNENIRPPCRAETIPKSVACEAINEPALPNACIQTSNKSAIPSTSKANYKNGISTHRPIKLCCAAVMETCLDDVSKSSMSSECSALALDSITKDKNFKSQETLATSCRDTCILNRSDCGVRTGSYSTSTCTDSPSYFCKCYECSLCACDVRS